MRERESKPWQDDTNVCEKVPAREETDSSRMTSPVGQVGRLLAHRYHVLLQ